MSYTWATYNDDLTITKGGGFLGVNGAEEVRQRIIIALQHYWQEYFLNRPAGVPWYELILGSKDSKMVKSLLHSTILSVPGVISILQISVVLPSLINNRQFSLYADVEVNGASGPSITEIVLSMRGN